MTALTIIICYLIVLLLLGLGSNMLFRGTSKDYMLASRSIGPFFLLMSLFGTTMTAFALVGSTAAAYRDGVGVYGKLASASGIVHSLCFLIIGVPLWRLGARHGFSTQIEFFRSRLKSRGIGIVLFPALVGFVVPYLLIGILGAGGVVNGVTQGAFPTAFENHGHGIPPNLASLVICLVVLIYVFFGGMRGTAWANALQTLVFMILGVLTFVVIANGIGGKDSFIESMKAATAQVDSEHITRQTISKINYASYLLIPLSVGMFPHVFQHWLTAKSSASFKLPIVVHPIFIMIVWVPCVLIGVWASAWRPGLPPPQANQVLALLVRDVSADQMVWLSGLLTAGILAAIMSSLDSQFLCLGTMFTNDIVMEYWGRDRFSERQKVWMVRGFVAGVVAVTYLISVALIATGKHTSVFAMGIWCFSGFTALVPLVLAALYWRRLTAAGAFASVITTMVVWGWLFYRADFGADRAFSFPIAGLLPVVTITACSTVALIAVSLVTRPPDDATLAKFFDK